jgi:hypothetical protein
LLDADGWKRCLKSAGLIGGLADDIAASGGESLLVFGEKSPKVAVTGVEPRSLLLVRSKSERAKAITASLSKLLLAEGHGVAVSDENDIERHASDGRRDHIVYVAPTSSDGDPADALARRCLNAKRVVERLQGGEADLWVVTMGAWSEGRDRFGAIESGLWTFMRTFANELGNARIHMADLATDLDSDAAGLKLADAVLTRTAETELAIRANENNAVRIVRVGSTQREETGEPMPAKLSRGAYGGLDRMSWTPLERVAPKDDEVEIEIEASGLNFRDLMWAMSLLPEEILEDGFAGATLGLEIGRTHCSQRPLRHGVQARRPSDGIYSIRIRQLRDRALPCRRAHPRLDVGRSGRDYSGGVLHRVLRARDAGATVAR